MIFGFPLTEELMRERYQYPTMMARCPHASGRERDGYELRVCGAIMASLSLKILEVWPNAAYDITPSGPVIGLITNKQSTTSPPREVIRSIQAFLSLDVEPRWIVA